MRTSSAKSTEKANHLVIVGPYGAGKTSLMAEIANQPNSPYYVTRNFTYRPRRPDEGDAELSFISQAAFDGPDMQAGFLSTHRTANLAYEYGVPFPERRSDRISMRALPLRLEYVQNFIDKTKAQGLGEVTVCQVVVTDLDVLEHRQRERDPNIAEDDLAARLASNRTSKNIAEELKGIIFENNYPTLADAGFALRTQLDARFSGTA